MAVNRLDILRHVITVTEIGKEGHKLLIENGISSVIKLINSTDDAYQYLVDK